MSIYYIAVVVQLLSPVQLFGTPWSQSFTISLSSLKHMFNELVMPSNHLLLCLLLLLPSIIPSGKIFSSESAVRIKWSKYWSFSLSISSSNEYSGLISFRIDWFDLFVVQWALKDLFQSHNQKTSILWHSVFFMVQLSHQYMTTEKKYKKTQL